MPTPDVRALRALILACEQYRQAVADHFGLGLTDTVAMSYLRAEGSLTARDLSERTGLTPSTVSTLLDRLEDVGFAARSPHPSDRRKVVVSLTEEGSAQLARSEDWLASVLASTAATDRDDIVRLAEQLAGGLEAETAKVRELPRLARPS